MYSHSIFKNKIVISKSCLKLVNITDVEEIIYKHEIQFTNRMKRTSDFQNEEYIITTSFDSQGTEFHIITQPINLITNIILKKEY